MVRMTSSRCRFFCAVCGEDIQSAMPAQAPIGRNNGLVNVCYDCNPANADDGRRSPPATDSERGAYEVQPPTGTLRKALARNDRKRLGVGYDAEMKRRQREGLAPVPTATAADLDERVINAETSRRWRTEANRRR